MKVTSAFVLVGCALSSGCDPAFGVRATIEAPADGRLSCAVNALKTHGYAASQTAENHATVTKEGRIANVHVSSKGFEVSFFSVPDRMSCQTIRESAPWLRGIVQAIKEDCAGKNAGPVAERWNQDQCGVSLDG